MGNGKGQLYNPSNLDLELEELGEKHLREMREEGLRDPSSSSLKRTSLKPKF